MTAAWTNPAEFARVSPVLVQMWVHMWQRLSPVPLQMWQRCAGLCKCGSVEPTLSKEQLVVVVQS